MSRPDLDSLGPPDAAVALRSFPRRYREAFADDSGGFDDEVAVRVGSDGQSAFGRLVETVRTLSLIERAIEQVEASDEPVLHAAVLDPTEREFDIGAHGSVADVLDELATVAPAFADRVDGFHGEAWARTGLVAGAEVTALDLLREAVRTGADNLREIERLLGD